MASRPGAIFFISFVVGVVQIVLSHAAGIDFSAPANAGHQFGYVECYNWSVIYLTVAPTILAACIPSTIVLYHRFGHDPANRIRFLILLVLAIAYAAATAGREAWLALYGTDDGSYSEWTSVSAGEWNAPGLSQLQSVSWHALFFLGYAHYIVASFFGFAGAFGTLWFFSLASRENKKRKLLPEEHGLLFNQKVAVLCYLLFLVILRSAKVSMSLIASGKAEETWSFFDFFKHGEAYLSNAMSGGIFLDLLFGVFWLSVTLVTHGFASKIVSPQTVTRTQAQFVYPIFNRIARAYTYFGRAPRFWAGVFLFAIVLPAPGFPLLIAQAVVFATLRLIKSGWQSAAD